MLVTPSGIVTLVSPLHQENAEFPMLVTPMPIVTLVSPLHQENAYSPMFVTLLGIVTLVRPLHSKNAQSPMLVTLSGIVIFVIFAQFLKAEVLICVIESGIVIAPLNSVPLRYTDCLLGISTELCSQSVIVPAKLTITASEPVGGYDCMLHGTVIAFRFVQP